MKVKKLLGNTTVYCILVVGAIIMVFPFLWMLLSSFKTFEEVSMLPPSLFPSEWHPENYYYAFKTAPFLRYFLNSAVVAIVVGAIQCFTTILAAFGFTRLNFRGRDTLFAVSLGMMMVPFEMLVITNYITIADWGLIDSLIAMIIPFTSSIFHTFILRGFFQSIPDSLYYSARIDGAGNWSYLWRVMVPIAKPAIVTNILLGTITSWNSFLWPMLVTNVQESRTLPFGLYAFMNEAGIRYERLMAGATIVVLPMIILFLFARKSIVSGVARGGIKG